MILRIVWESLARRRRRKLLSVFAVALGIAVTAAVSTLGLDVGDKVNRELRSFGANLSVTPAADGLPVAVGGIDYRPAGAGAPGLIRPGRRPRTRPRTGGSREGSR